MQPSRELVERTEAAARRLLEGDSGGHDWWHTDRVRRLALSIAKLEGADALVVELAALLHDVDDFKKSGSETAGARRAQELLRELGCDHDMADRVAEIISKVAFQGSAVEELRSSLEGMCVRDADRLDALGAVGVARAFAYGGTIGRPMHDPGYLPQAKQTRDEYRSNMGTTLGHFSEKLLLLRDRMGTATGRLVAMRRHEVMTDFVRNFLAEWDGTDVLKPDPDKRSAGSSPVEDSER